MVGLGGIAGRGADAAVFLVEEIVGGEVLADSKSPELAGFFMEKLGNIKTDNITQLWSSDKAKEIRKQMNGCRKNCELVVNCYYENEY